MQSTKDPYDCFGSDSESEHCEAVCPATESSTSWNISSTSSNQNSSSNTPIIRQSTNREESCGVLAFHPNTEQSLLMHVRNSIRRPDPSDDRQQSTASSSSSPSEQVLSEIDWYCLHRHWMMCIGPEKGALVTNSLESSIQHHLQCSRENKKRRFIAVELGTYCGYGSIFISQYLKKQFQQQQHSDGGKTFQLLTVEINPEFAKIAREMIELAQVQDVVTVLENELRMDGNASDIGALLKDFLRNDSDDTSCEWIDFLMIDHDKESYLRDLKILEKSGLIRGGTVVVADNVIFAGIHEYMDYMRGLAERGIVRTCTKEASVEYCFPDMKQCGGNLDAEIFKDGVEITEYLQDPE